MKLNEVILYCDKQTSRLGLTSPLLPNQNGNVFLILVLTEYNVGNCKQLAIHVAWLQFFFKRAVK